MPIDLDILKNKIQNAIPGAQVWVKDLAGDRDHLEAVVISDLFEGKSPLTRHRMVYDKLQEILKDQLHALALKTYTPQQWEILQKNNR